MTSRLGKIIIVGLIILWLYSGALSTSVAQSSSSQRSASEQRAQQIWEQAVSAKGGRARLEAVQNLLISVSGEYATAAGKQNSLRTETLFVFPNKIWRWMDYRPDVFGLTVESYNFDTGVKYVVNSDRSPAVAHAIGSSESVTDHSYGVLSYLLETRWLRPNLLSVTSQSIDSHMVDIVHTVLRSQIPGFMDQSRYIDFAFDRHSHLPLRVTYSHEQNEKEVVDLVENFSDYQEINGIKFPRKAEVSGSVESISIKVNEEYNRDLFESPPSVAAGVEAWRPKKTN
jgi:hypothetical protein